MKEVIKNKFYLYCSYIMVISLFLITIQNSFFWDTIQLGSLHANYYLTTNFTNLLLPNDIDSGHIPAFGIYIGLLWKIFGRSLIVSHLAMLPFIIGIVYQLKKTTDYFLESKYSGIALFLIILDPTLLSQITLVSPDIPLIFFFFFSLNSILKNNKKELLIGIIFLFLISMRGMMVAFCLLIIDLIVNINFKKPHRTLPSSLLKRSVLYLPAFIIFILFNLYHYNVKGWFGFHSDSPWNTSFEPVDLKGFLFNIGILGWRILDFGRIGIWIAFMMLFIKYRKKAFKDPKTRLLFIISIIFIIILPLNMIWAKGLLGHRYLLPIFLIFALLTVKILFTFCENLKLRKGLILLWLLFIITGNFWVYPDKVSQGWDATLAHLPYYKLRQKTISYLDGKKIDFKEVSSFFPISGILDNIDLSGDLRGVKTFDEEGKYVIYSNINNVSDNDYDKLNNEYKIIKEFRNKSIFFKIYEKKSN